MTYVYCPTGSVGWESCMSPHWAPCSGPHQLHSKHQPWLPLHLELGPPPGSGCWQNSGLRSCQLLTQGRCFQLPETARHPLSPDTNPLPSALAPEAIRTTSP